MLKLTRESLAALVAERDRCSGGRSEGCATCGLRNSCRLDEARRADWTPERIAALVQANLTARNILRTVEWEPEDV